MICRWPYLQDWSYLACFWGTVKERPHRKIKHESLDEVQILASFPSGGLILLRRN